MPISLRIPPPTEKLIARVAAATGRTKSAVILEAVEEKLGISRSRAALVRELAGFLSHDEAEELRRATDVFAVIHEGDWP
ncbi:MAG: hypothetical protein AB1634_14870 [Thermodesulfobacteriota bacterium]